MSVSQIFAGLTIATTYPLFFGNQENRETWKRLQIPFFVFLGIYILTLISSLISAETYGPFFKKFIKQSEFGDFWMLFLFPASFLIASKEKNQKLLRGFLYASAAISVLLGCISLFSEVRVGKFVSNGFKYALGDRLQHYSGNIGPIKLYLPIGMMNTHLTFGGLLGLCLPGLVADWFAGWNEKKGKTFIFKTILIFAGFVVLFFNQSRSIWLGVGFILLLLILNGNLSLREKLPNLSLRWKLVSGILIFCVFISAGYLFRNNWLIQRSISQIFEVHNTENQRYYIYKNTIPLIRDHLWIGVGGGNYKDSHWKESSQMIFEDEQLWYELYITPRGHAHNDLLHWMTVGGIFAGIFFLLFWGNLFHPFFQNKLESKKSLSILTIGIFSLFPAGFFQCYLLDDEVLLPFFVFCGIFLGGMSSQKDKTSFDKSKLVYFKIFGAIGIPILLYWLFWIPRLNLKPLEVYNRRVRSVDQAIVRTVQKNILKLESTDTQETLSPPDFSDLTFAQARIPFQIEGCLTHRYPNPPQPRKTPFSFTVYIHPSAQNFPQETEITIVSRESFDQDQQYWAQAEEDLGKIQVSLKTGKNPVLIPNFLLKNSSPEFPNGVYFRDFRITFKGWKEDRKIEFPKLYFGKICDTVIPLTR